MSLPDHDSDSVQRMVRWLYARELGLTVPVSPQTSVECYMQLAKLNTLTDKYDIHLLKNRIVDELFDLAKPPRNIKPPQMRVIKYIYDNTTKGSSFRKLMVAWHAYHIAFEWYDRESTRNALAKISDELAIDLAMELGSRLKDPNRRNPFTLPSSDYHETPPEKK